MRKGGEPKYAHLSMELHVFIEVFAPVPDAYLRMAHAMEEVKKFLFPVSVYLPKCSSATLTHLVQWPDGEEIVCGSTSADRTDTHQNHTSVYSSFLIVFLRQMVRFQELDATGLLTVRCVPKWP